MKKINEIIHTLNFYVCSNELKNKIIDETNNYSVADQLFGSMILATAIDSEFKETSNLSKIYRLLLLSEFSILYPNYNFDNLILGKQYAKEILEARDINNENGKLVFKYKMLDFLLTKLIKEKESNITPSELIKEGSTIISSLCSKQPYECEEIFKFYYLNFRLKNKVRTGWDSKHWNVKSDRIETISEHVIGTIGLAIVLNSEFKYNFDTDKEQKMLVIHETGKTLIGDITPFDGISPEKKKEIKHQAMRDALGNLKEKDSLLNLLFEFDEQETPEAKYSNYCDKIEASLKAKLNQDKGIHFSLDSQKNWYEWDKTIYAGDNQFPEFANILKIARANNLLHLAKVIKERINLTDEEHSFLTEKLAEIINDLYKDNNIDSVYLTNYQDSKYSKGKLKITVLFKSSKNYIDILTLMENLNIIIANDNKTGVNVEFCYDYENRYSTIAMNPNEVSRVEQLVESKILFDKSGNISKVKEATKNQSHLYKFYLVDFVPPVDESIALKLTKNK